MTYSGSLKHHTANLLFPSLCTEIQKFRKKITPKWLCQRMWSKFINKTKSGWSVHLEAPGSNCLPFTKTSVFSYDCSSLFSVLLFYLEKWWNAEKKRAGGYKKKRAEMGGKREDRVMKSVASMLHLNWWTCGVKKLTLLPKPQTQGLVYFHTCTQVPMEHYSFA